MASSSSRRTLPATNLTFKPALLWGSAWNLLCCGAVLCALTLCSLSLFTLYHIERERQLHTPEQWLHSSKPAHTTAQQLRTQISSTSRNHISVYEQRAQQAVHDRKPVRLKYPIVWASAFWSASGYGSEAISYIIGLLDSGLIAKEDVWILQKGDAIHSSVVDSMTPRVKKVLEEQDLLNITKRMSKEDSNRPLVSICHCFPDCFWTPREESWLYPKHYTKALEKAFKHGFLGQPEESGCPCPDKFLESRVVYKIGRSMFETEALPAALADYTQLLDEVWVPSNSNVRAFELGGVPPSKLFTLPQGVDTQHFDPASHTPYDLSQGTLVFGTPISGSDASGPRPFRFLSVFKWEARKNWPMLLKAYVQEFRQDSQNVELHIVTKASEEKVADDFRSYIRKKAAHHLSITHSSQYDTLPRLWVHEQHIPESQYPSLYLACDALCVPTHGEGWGRPQIEAMSMGKPVISTNWSGLTEFLIEDVGYPIRVEAIVEAEGGDWFKHQRWAQPSMTHLRQLMRQVVQNPGEAAAKGAAARQHVLQHFSLTAVAQKLLVQILRVQDVVDQLLQKESTHLSGRVPKETPLPALPSNDASSHVAYVLLLSDTPTAPPDLLHSLQLFKQNMLPSTPGRVLLFYTGECSDTKQASILQLLPSAEFVQVPEEAWTVPEGLPDIKHWNFAPCCPEHGVGYRHMCRWFSNRIFKFLAANYSSIRWVIRLDEDSKVLSPVQANMAAWMQANKKLYGYRLWDEDDEEIIWSLPEVTMAFLTMNKIQPTFLLDSCRPPKLTSLNSQGGWDRKVIYTNFFILDLQWWMRSQIQDYLDVLDKANGAYLYRWGDAPVHTMVVKIFLSRSQIHQFGFAYRHKDNYDVSRRRWLPDLRPLLP